MTDEKVVHLELTEQDLQHFESVCLDAVQHLAGNREDIPKRLRESNLRVRGIFAEVRAKQADHITIAAKRWFQRTYGNTYHTVRVLVNGELIGSSGKTYGYGEQYLQTAHDILAKHGRFSWEIDKTPVENLFLNGQPSGSYHEKTYDNQNAAWEAFSKDRREHRERYHITVTDVAREKDL